LSRSDAWSEYFEAARPLEEARRRFGEGVGKSSEAARTRVKSAS
jgi:hypothetical protein